MPRLGARPYGKRGKGGWKTGTGLGYPKRGKVDDIRVDLHRRGGAEGTKKQPSGPTLGNAYG